MENTAVKHKSYRDYIQFKILVLVVLVVLTFLAALISIAAGSAGLTIKEVFLTLIGRGTEATKTVVLNLRLTRVLASIIGGIGLGITGCAMR